jgi:FHA domain-containing protein
MKFEIRYPTGGVHRVEFPGTLMSVGRDPGCDLVLSDSKCSRRHAVIEAGPTGLAVRDTGSANGVFLNGKKIERAVLLDGDLLRMGEVIIKVIAEGAAGTVVVGPEDLEPLPRPLLSKSLSSLTETDIDEVAAVVVQRAGPPPKQVRPSADTGRAVALRGPVPRPLTVSVLAVLWALGALVFAGGGLLAALALQWAGAAAWGAALGGLVLAALGAGLAFGLWARSPWARPLQIVLAGLGILACPFLPAAITTLIYMLRPEVRAAFSGKRDLGDLPPAEAEALRTGAAETAFSLSILGMVLLGLIAIALLGFLAPRGSRPGF